MKKFILILFLLLIVQSANSQVWMLSGDTLTVPHRITEYFPNAFYTWQDSVTNLYDSLKGTNFVELTLYSTSSFIIGMDSTMGTANTYTTWPASVVYYATFPLRGAKNTDIWIKPVTGTVTINGQIRVW